VEESSRQRVLIGDEVVNVLRTFGVVATTYPVTKWLNVCDVIESAVCQRNDVVRHQNQSECDEFRFVSVTANASTSKTMLQRLPVQSSEVFSTSSATSLKSVCGEEVQGGGDPAMC
jgi:hypothetical protein